jgi:hypothetical protein
MVSDDARAVNKKTLTHAKRNQLHARAQAKMFFPRHGNRNRGMLMLPEHVARTIVEHGSCCMGVR